MKTIQMPYSDLAEALGVPDLYLKREDEHKYGSHKGRSIPLMIKTYHKEGITHFTISSSGNAALAAILAAESRIKNNPESPIFLKVFVGENIEPKKLRKLERAITEKNNITIEQTENPKQRAFLLEKEGQAKNLRQSTDDLALEGYFELGEELAKIPNLCAVFVPTSSGTTAQALGQYFVENNHPIGVHIVQSTSCHPMAQDFDTPPNNGTSVAKAIVDRVAHRHDAVIEAVKNSNGSGWIPDNPEIREMKKLVQEKTGIHISLNSALSLAGLKKAVDSGFVFPGPVACLVCGD